MSLISALNIGKSALATHQAAIQVTGNNIANAGNPNYTRQVARVEPNKDQELRPGLFMGTGINLSAVQRQVDEALLARVRASVSDNTSASTLEQWLGRVESVFNELSDEDLSTQLSEFFASWSNLANRPGDTALRDVVVRKGESLAGWIRSTRDDLLALQSDADSRLKALVGDANSLADQVAYLNQQITVAEGGGAGQANGLRDQRDGVLRQLAELVDIRTVNNGSMVNVYVGSESLVDSVTNRGLALKQETVDEKLRTSVVLKATGAALAVEGGQIGALMDVRANQIDQVIGEVDTLASGLIFELNKIHASGQGTRGFATLTSTNYAVDTAAALNSAAADLDFKPVNGSFVVHVRDKQSGLVTSTLIQVDLDGQGAETSLDSLATALDAVSNISAGISGGRLTLAADSDRVDISFSQDTSGVLAALGLNTFFSGTDAGSIAVNQTVRADSALLAAATRTDATATARAIAAMESAPLAGLGGSTLSQNYQAIINSIGVSAANARTGAEASRVVLETLDAQREALSGVSLDEEAVNLIRQQRAFQGAARLISAIDEMMQTILNLV